MITKKRVAIIAGGVVLGAALFLFITEYLFFFPFTYYSLDIECHTKLTQSTDEVTVLFVGDIMLDETARASVRSFGYDYPFVKTKHLIERADVAIGNLEGPVTSKCTKIPGKKWSYQVSPRAARGLAVAGFDGMILANNHMTDCGDAGITESIQHLNAAGVVPFGGGLTPQAARKPYIVKRKGVTIGVLAYLAPYIYLKGKKFSYFNYSASRYHGGGAYGLRRDVKADVKALKAKVDVVVVVYHVGDRYIKKLRPDHMKMLHGTIDMGADAVVCHGTHIAGPVGSYKGRPVIQGVGNFAFGSVNPWATFGLISVLHINRTTKRITRTQNIPVYTNNFKPLVNHRPLVLKGLMARKFLTSLMERSAPFESRLVRHGNKLWQRFP